MGIKQTLDKVLGAEKKQMKMGDWLDAVLPRYAEFVTVRPDGRHKTDMEKLILELGMPGIQAKALRAYLNKHTKEEALERRLAEKGEGTQSTN